MSLLIEFLSSSDACDFYRGALGVLGAGYVKFLFDRYVKMESPLRRKPRASGSDTNPKGKSRKSRRRTAGASQHANRETLLSFGGAQRRRKPNDMASFPKNLAVSDLPTKNDNTMRPIITLDAVKTAVADLRKQEKKPTCGNLYVHFAGRGSMTSINKYRRQVLKLPPLPTKAKPRKGKAIAPDIRAIQRGLSDGRSPPEPIKPTDLHL